jgi:GLPGLI family protein
MKKTAGILILIGRMNMQKQIAGTNFVMLTTQNEWKITNENREIVDNCRKAVGNNGRMFMYLLFTRMISISGGPCSINGLPGMIFRTYHSTTIYLICSNQSRCVC